MPLTINLRDPDTGDITPVTIPDYEELTLANWKAFNPIDAPSEEGLDADIRKVCLYTGLPENTVAQWGSGVFASVLMHVSAELLRAYQGSDRFKKCMAEGTDFVPDPVITVNGKSYDVPLDLDRITIGQFADWERWEAPAHEADIVAESLAFMLTDLGEGYNGADAARIAEMMAFPMEQAFDLCAFFFSASDRFATVTYQRSRKFQSWTRHLLMNTLRTSESAIGALISYTGQPV